MKKLSYYLLMLLIPALMIAGCSKDKGPAVVKDVVLSETILTLSEGDNETLTVTISPADVENKSIEWKSSNVSIATVDNNGKVTAIKAGDVVITATSVNGVVAECRITVVKPVLPVTGVTLNKTSIGLITGTKETLVATIAPVAAANKNLTWASDKPAIATVSNTGEVTAVAVGTATITVTTVDGSKTAKCTCRFNE